MTLPIVITVETGGAGAPPVSKPVSEFDRIVAAAPTSPAAGEGTSPVASAPAARPDVPAAPAPPEAVRNSILRIVMGREEKRLRCTQEDVTGFVGMSYIAGGFPMVVAARRALEAGVEGLAKDDKAAQEGLTELDEMAGDMTKQLSAGAASRALLEARTIAANRRTALRGAQASLPVYAEYFRKAWTAIAAYEETLVRRYDRELAVALRAVAEENRKLAASEWAKYAPTGAEADKALPFDTAKLDDVETLALSRALVDELVPPKQSTSGSSSGGGSSTTTTAPATPTKDERDKAIEALWQHALKLYELATDVRVNRAVAAKGKSKDPKAVGDRVTYWNAKRTEIAAKYPVLLQVYPRIGSVNEANTMRTRFGKEIAGALIRTRDECARIARETITAWDSPGRMRVVPNPTPKPDGTYTLPESDLNRKIGTTTETRKQGEEVVSTQRDVPLRTILDSAHLAAARSFGLTIPASEVVGGLLNWDANRSRNSGWMHAPAGFEVMRRARGNSELAPFFEAGRIAHAAVSRALDSNAARRQRQKTWEGRGLLLMWGVAALLAPFTQGATLYGASIVQAGVSAHEIYTSVSDYQDAAGLSAVSLSAIDEASWCRPSTVKLVRTIMADSADVVQNTIGARGLPIVLDLVLGALALAHPGEPEGAAKR